jgi:hypothetical protein
MLSNVMICGAKPDVLLCCFGAASWLGLRGEACEFAGRAFPNFSRSSRAPPLCSIHQPIASPRAQATAHRTRYLHDIHEHYT